MIVQRLQHVLMMFYCLGISCVARKRLFELRRRRISRTCLRQTPKRANEAEQSQGSLLQTSKAHNYHETSISNMNQKKWRLACTQRPAEAKLGAETLFGGPAGEEPLHSPYFSAPFVFKFIFDVYFTYFRGFPRRVKNRKRGAPRAGNPSTPAGVKFITKCHSTYFCTVRLKIQCRAQ